MKALTVCQPYAALICLPDDDDRAKRVENRKWSSGFVGSLAIHAGKSRQWLDGDNYGLTESEMPFGAIVGVCRVAGIFMVNYGAHSRPTIPDSALRRWPWLAGHEHVEGPYCWVLTECRVLPEPIPYRGAQGLFDVPDEVLSALPREPGNPQ